MRKVRGMPHVHTVTKYQTIGDAGVYYAAQWDLINVHIFDFPTSFSPSCKELMSMLTLILMCAH